MLAETDEHDLHHSLITYSYLKSHGADIELRVAGFWHCINADRTELFTGVFPQRVCLLIEMAKQTSSDEYSADALLLREAYACKSAEGSYSGLLLSAIADSLWLAN